MPDLVAGAPAEAARRGSRSDRGSRRSPGKASIAISSSGCAACACASRATATCRRTSSSTTRTLRELARLKPTTSRRAASRLRRRRPQGRRARRRRGRSHSRARWSVESTCQGRGQRAQGTGEGRGHRVQVRNALALAIGFVEKADPRQQVPHFCPLPFVLPCALCPLPCLGRASCPASCLTVHNARRRAPSFSRPTPRDSAAAPTS